AIIKNIFIAEGRAVVQVGDKVSKGQELISPILYDTNGEILATTVPKGRVYGSVVFNASKTIAHRQTLWVDTGNKKTRTSLKIFGMEFGKNEKPPYEHYRKIETKGWLFGKSFLPIAYTQTTYFEQKQTMQENDIEAQKEETIAQLQEYLLLKANGNVTNVSSDVREIIGGYRIDVFVEAYLLLNG
ncbi:MAG: sporulation protein YqfD, partial [Firmicutes bacterium]|nr:sporulation protein YqfD [Bacillota bacterium]